MTFNSTDACLLESIKFSENNKGATLTDIISTVDYINHAIMTFSEFDKGIKKLTNCGLIEYQDKTFLTTDKFKVWWIKKFKNKKRVGVLKTMEEIEKYLTMNFGTIESHPNMADNPFTKKDFEKATSDYLNQAQKTLDKLIKKKKK